MRGRHSAIEQAVPPTSLWTRWTTQARCPHVHSDNNKRRQPFENAPKSPTRLHEEAFSGRRRDEFGGRLTATARAADGEVEKMMGRGRWHCSIPPQTAKRWPDYCPKARNASPIIATSRETKSDGAKSA